MSTYSEELKEAEKTVTITPVPLVMDKPGETFRGMYLGQKVWDKVDPKTGEMKQMRVAHFYDGEKILFQMGAQLTRAIADLKPGVSVEVVLKELKPNQHNGKTKIFSITPLKIPVKNLEEMLGGFLNIAPPADEHLIAAPVAAPAAPEPELDKSSNAEIDAWLASKDAEAEASRRASQAKLENTRAKMYNPA